MNKVIYAVVDDDYYPNWELEDSLDDFDALIDGGRDFVGYKQEEIYHWKSLFNESWGLSEEEVIDSFTRWGVPINEEQIKKLISIYETLGSSESHRETEFVLACLEIAHKKEYKEVAIRGCCQGDYADLYIPSDVNYEEISYIESLYFNTGTALIIHDEENIPQNPDEIRGFSAYTDKYSEEDIKDFIRKSYGEEDSTVVLWVIKAYKHVPVYERI